MNAVVLAQGASYRDWWATCPHCASTWAETTHSLWNVCALSCPDCTALLVLTNTDFHGDDNAPSE